MVVGVDMTMSKLLVYNLQLHLHQHILTNIILSPLIILPSLQLILQVLSQLLLLSFQLLVDLYIFLLHLHGMKNFSILI